VTDWAVAPIPSSEAPTAVLAPSLAVDDEPEDAPVGLAVQLPAPREGDVLDADEPSADDDDSEGVDLDVAPEQAPVVAQRIARAPDGTQRYGEAVVRQLRENLGLLGVNEQAEVVRGDAARLLRGRPERPFDLVFLDPPYVLRTLPKLCHLLEENGWLADAAWIYLEQESHRPWFGLPAGWSVHREAVAGQAACRLVRRVKITNPT